VSPDSKVPEEDGTGLFAEDVIHSLALDIGPTSWEALLLEPRVYVPATLRIGDRVLEDVGVRLKGSRSFRPIDSGAKPAFKIKLDEFIEQEYEGLVRITLNSASQDASAAHERLFYQFARAAGVPAPRASSVHLRVNGQDYGLYVNVEAEDKRFLRRWFERDEGNLYEGVFVDVDSYSVSDFELETNEAQNDRSDLMQLAEALDLVPQLGFRAAMSSHLDVDAMLRYAAVEGIAAQEDGYAYGSGELPPNNYRLYSDPVSGFQILPWGVDVSMHRQTGIFGIHGRLLYTCVSEASCRGDYVAQVRSTLEIFEALDLASEMADLRSQLSALQESDPRSEHSAAEVEAAWAALAAFVSDRPQVIRERLELE
jgi:spore coat protein CotH